MKSFVASTCVGIMILAIAYIFIRLTYLEQQVKTLLAFVQPPDAVGIHDGHFDQSNSDISMVDQEVKIDDEFVCLHTSSHPPQCPHKNEWCASELNMEDSEVDTEVAQLCGDAELCYLHRTPPDACENELKPRCSVESQRDNTITPNTITPINDEDEEECPPHAQICDDELETKVDDERLPSPTPEPAGHQEKPKRKKKDRNI